MKDANAPPNLLPLITGYWVSQSIYVAAKLGLADLVKDGPRSADELATATRTHPHALYRLLRALAGVAIFAEDEQGRFGLTPLAGCLLSDAPNSQRSAAITNGEEHYRVWGELLYSIRTGQTAFEHLFGAPIFDWLSKNPVQAKLFDETMTGVHGAETAAMIDAYDFTPFALLVDVGGGNGLTLSDILRRYPSLRGILFDRPHVVERARTAVESVGLSARCERVGGDFFQSVPSGGDVYLMRHIIHDWYDEQCLTILGNCRKAMGPTAKLLIVESVIPPGNTRCMAKFLDLTMLVIPGGMERTETEYRALLAKAGFRLTRIVPTQLEVAFLEAAPV